MPRHYQPEGSFLILPITSSTHTNLRRFPVQQSSCRRRNRNISARCRTRTHKAVTPNGFQIRALIQPDTEHIRFPQQNTSQIEWGGMILRFHLLPNPAQESREREELSGAGTLAGGFCIEKISVLFLRRQCHANSYRDGICLDGTGAERSMNERSE